MEPKSKSMCGADAKHCNSLDMQYWDLQWQNASTGWDIGYAAPAICRYLDQYKNKSAKLLIPGCGNAYEAQYLLDLGFEHITILDISPTAVLQLQEKFKDVPQLQVLQQDFFKHEGQYDLILEQTFFCALMPSMRPAYVQQMHKLLKPQGKLVGILFNRHFEQQGPPFGGDIPEYEALFKPYFNIQLLQENSNSIPQRAGTEAFFILKKS